MWRPFLVLVYALVSFSAKGEDTLRVSLHKADSIFLKNNLQLLAEQYNISASEALILQEKLWQNPSLQTEWSLYNNTNQRYFDVGINGQKILSIEQVILLAGKRNKRIQLAIAHKEISEHLFVELLRTLKFQLRSNFYNIYFNQATVNGYNRQLDLLDNTIKAFEVQYEKNNLSLKEIVRLKALYFQLYNDRTKLLATISNDQQELQTLLQTEAYIIPEYDKSGIEKYSLEKLKDTNLETLALQNRPDLKIAASMTSQAAINYKLQKSLSVPDLKVGLTYDQAGSYINHYLGVTAGIDLPFFNRNQGNIKYAKSQLQSYTYQQQSKELYIKNEVASALHKLTEIEKEYQRIDKNFSHQFEQLNTGLVSNFQKRNISLIEFIDLFEAYNESIYQLNILNAWRIENYEEMNYIVGTELFD
jgi:cobalt-zinc-cadmium efflux system outer membrane protein